MNPHLDPLLAERCCLMVIDPQERLMQAIHKADRVTRNTALLVRCFQTMKLPVIATTQYKKGLGPFVPELAELLAATPCPDKLEFNALANPAVRAELDRLPKKVDTLILTGAEAHICVYQTACGALRAGYRTWVTSDAVSSRDKKNAKAALQRLALLGAEVGPSEMVIYELLQRAGSPAFKAMLPHLK